MEFVPINTPFSEVAGDAATDGMTRLDARPSPRPTIGRIVHYTLNEADAAAINVRRADYRAFEAGHAHPHEPGQPAASGHQAHVGNHAEAGQVYPATVVRVFFPSASTANLQVLLDGNDTYWATSRTEGEGAGHWAWPPRV